MSRSLKTINQMQKIREKILVGNLCTIKCKKGDHKEGAKVSHAWESSQLLKIH